MDKMILGRYIPGNSILHRLDPRAKLIGMLIFILLLFWANNVFTNVVLILFVFGGILLSKLSFSLFLKGLRPMFYLLAFTTIFQLFFTSSGVVLWQFAFLKITVTGIQQASIIFVRFILIIFVSTLLTLTTSPFSLADAVESLLNPLTIVKVPAHEIGLMLSLSLRFVPTLMDDTTRIMNAQRARGVDFGEGTIIQKVKSIIPILIPLFASSLKRADALGIAMEARGYRGGESRTRYRQLKWKCQDSLLLLILLLLAFLLFFLKS